VKADGSDQAGVTLPTLGPTGTRHERDVVEYMRFQGDQGLRDRAHGRPHQRPGEHPGERGRLPDQCSAHPRVPRVTKRWSEVFVFDTSICPTKTLAATAGYLDFTQRGEVAAVESKPIAAKDLLAGRYAAGVARLEHLAAHPDEVLLSDEIGEIDTTQVVNRSRKRSTAR
jgi:hypothetical protein